MRYLVFMTVLFSGLLAHAQSAECSYYTTIDDVKSKYFIDNSAKVYREMTKSSCELMFFDHIVDKVVETNSVTYYLLLDKFSQHVDGAVSEYFVSVSKRIFEKDFVDLIDFLYLHRESQLFDMVTYALSTESYYSGNPKQRAIEYKEKGEQLSKSWAKSRDKRKFVAKFLSGIDSKNVE